MNTFLPLPSFQKSAACLDTIRLKNQLNECKVIKSALEGAKPWASHPATKMWVDWPRALESYMSAIASEMWKRGLKVPEWAPTGPLGVYPLPIWFGCTALHQSHRQNLLRKNPTHYGSFFPEDVPSDVYAWPTKIDGVWVMKFKTVGAKCYFGVTEPIIPQGSNRSGDTFE